MFDEMVNRLKALRVQKRIKQADLAKKIGIAASYLSLLENGHNSPGIVTLEAWANSLGLGLSIELKAKEAQK